MTERDLRELQREIAQHEKEIQREAQALETARQASALRVAKHEQALAIKMGILRQHAPHLCRTGSAPAIKPGPGRKKGN